MASFFKLTKGFPYDTYCVYARNLWLSLLNPTYISAFFGSSLRDWGILNLQRDLSRGKSGNWDLIWGVTIWKLWLWRNEECFNEDFEKPCNPSDIILNCVKTYVHLQVNIAQSSLISDSSGIWQPPDYDWIKLNVDGAVSIIDNKAGCGGVVRNHDGDWIVGFSHVIGFSSVFEAEEWALLKGLSLVWDLGCRKVIVESDALDLVECLNDGRSRHTGDLILWKIWELLRKNWLVKIQFIPRNGNMVADALAKTGISSSAFFDVCPEYLRAMVSQEKLGLLSPV